MVAYSLSNLARFYQSQENDAEALSLFEQALAIRNALLGENHFEVAQSLHDLASVYKAQGETDKANALRQQAKELENKIYSTELKELIASNNETARYQIKGEVISVLPLSRLVLNTTENLLGNNHLDVSYCLNNLAALYISSQNDYVSALPLYQRALAIRERLLGENNPYVVQSRNNFAKLYGNQEKC